MDVTPLPTPPSPAARASEALSALVAAYLRGSSETRQGLTSAHPLLFTGDTLLALEAAAAELAATRAQASEVVSAIDELAAAVDLPQETAVAALSGEERQMLEDPEVMVQHFTRTLTDLIGRAVALEKGGGNAAGLPSQPPALAVSHAGAEALPWHQTASITLVVLSYLSVEEVLLTAENVCRAWRYWLYQPEFSKFFWIEAVQRDYPEELGQLIQLHGSDIMQSDWRTLAMVMCAGEDDAAEQEEEEEEA